MDEALTTLRKIVFEGGAINWVIIAMYAVMILFSIERLICYLASSYRKSVVRKEVRALKTKEDIEAMLSKKWSLRYRHCAPIMIVKQFYDSIESERDVMNESLDFRAEEIHNSLNRHLNILSLISGVAPLCGLLGTVTGLMAAFNAIERAGGTVEMGSLAGGIWTAMITTATGLIVAIPAMIFVRTFERVQENRLNDVSETVSILKQRFRPDCL